MSWIIQSLLNRKNYIHEVSDSEDDDYNDLLLIEKAIETLKEKEELSLEDTNIIGEMTGDIVGLVYKEMGQKKQVYKKYTEICKKIGEYMGGYFTDDGYLDYMKDKYKLSDTQMETLRNYISSVFKHKLIKKEPTNGYKR